MASTIPAAGATHSRTRAASTPPCTPGSRSGFEERGHQLEKLQFAHAIASMRGDVERSELLKRQIAELGGNAEEPGT